MFFIVGSRRTNSVLGQAMHACARCQQQSYFTYTRQSRWFTFFFIPIIPLGSTTYASCNTCRFQSSVPNNVADMTLAQARQMQAGQPPSMQPQQKQQGYPQQQPQGYPQQQQQQQQGYPQQQQQQAYGQPPQQPYPYGGGYPPRQQ